MGKISALIYALLCYAVFFLAFLYAIGFVAGPVGGFGVPKAIDDGPPVSLLTALMVDTLLLGVFAVQHSVMARPAFKVVWTKIVPKPVERSTYVLFASLALVLLFWQWRPVAAPIIWRVTTPILADVIWGLFGLGWLIVLTSTFLINHFDLFGLRQVWTYVRNGETPPADFRTPFFYRVVRHPLYVGFIMAFWAAPVMSAGHLLFAFATTVYILIAIQLEEHDLIGVFGDRYRTYQKTVSMIIPAPPRTGV